MNSLPIECKDNLVYFMQTGVLRLGNYDRRFIENLLYQISANKPITTNQAKLFDLLVDKYKRQLHMQGISESKLRKLSWNATVIQSDKKHTDAYIEIANDTIIFRSPYNKKFLDKIRGYPNSGFKWDKTEKAHIAQYSTYSLKAIVTTSNEIFPLLNFCDITKTLLNELLVYEPVKYWDPTLVCVNGKYLIAASNNHLNDKIKHLPLEPTPENLCKLSQYGINVDDAITNNDPVLEFASKYFAEFDLVNIDMLVEYLKEIKCDGVTLFQGSVLMPRIHKKIITTAMSDNNINIVESSDKHCNNLVTIIIYGAKKRMSEYSFMMEERQQFSKVILLKDSSPIDIK